MEGVVVQGGYPRPSALLEAQREAEAARVRCKRLLPTLWVAFLDILQSKAVRMEESLQLMVELQDDSLLAPPGRARATIVQRVKAALARGICAAEREAELRKPSTAPEITCSGCSGCKRVAPTLRKCAACKQAQYCRCELGACLRVQPLALLIAR